MTPALAGYALQVLIVLAPILLGAIMWALALALLRRAIRRIIRHISDFLHPQEESPTMITRAMEIEHSIEGRRLYQSMIEHGYTAIVGAKDPGRSRLVVFQKPGDLPAPNITREFLAEVLERNRSK